MRQAEGKVLLRWFLSKADKILGQVNEPVGEGRARACRRDRSTVTGCKSLGCLDSVKDA